MGTANNGDEGQAAKAAMIEETEIRDSVRADLVQEVGFGGGDDVSDGEHGSEYGGEEAPATAACSGSLVTPADMQSSSNPYHGCVQLKGPYSRSRCNKKYQCPVAYENVCKQCVYNAGDEECQRGRVCQERPRPRPRPRP